MGFPTHVCVVQETALRPSGGPPHSRLVGPVNGATLGAVKPVRAAGLFILALLGLAGCYREATDASAAAARVRPSATARWTIDGVRPGQDFNEVKRLLGEPREIRGKSGPRTAFWERNGTAVTFGTDGIVTEAMGATVQAEGQVLFSAGATEAEVVQILGPGKVQKSHRPTSGVISLTRVHTGTALIYDNGGVRFELPVFGEATGHFLARRAP